MHYHVGTRKAAASGSGGTPRNRRRTVGAASLALPLPPPPEPKVRLCRHTFYVSEEMTLGRLVPSSEHSQEDILGEMATPYVCQRALVSFELA